MVQEGHEWCRFAWGAMMEWQQVHCEDGPGLGGWMEVGRWQYVQMIGSCGSGWGGALAGDGCVHDVSGRGIDGGRRDFWG